MENAKEILMTKEGLEKLENELEELKVVRRKEVAEKIKQALAFLATCRRILSTMRRKTSRRRLRHGLRREKECSRLRGSLITIVSARMRSASAHG